MTPLAIAIVAFTLGALVSASAIWWFVKEGWNHALHCNFCKEKFFFEPLSEHEDHGTACAWKRIMRRKSGA